MKKIITLCLFAIFAFGSASAQGWRLGGTFGFWHTDKNHTHSNEFSLTPEVGYEFNSKWSVALGLGYAHSSAYIDKNFDYSTDVVAINPYARFTFYRQGILGLFVNGGFAVAAGDTDGFMIGLSPGLSLDVTKNFRFVATAGFLGYKNGYYNGGGDGFGLGLTTQDLKFGFEYRF